jgi:hypothetical protein
VPATDIVDSIMRFQRALSALKPLFNEADIGPGLGEAGDRYDRAAEALWDSLVRASPGLRDIPAYGYDAAPGQPRIVIRYGDAVHEFSEFVDETRISSSPFSVVAVNPSLMLPLSDVTFEFAPGDA